MTIQYQQTLSQSSVNKYCHNPVSKNIATIQYQQISPQSSINKYCHNPLSTNIVTIQYRKKCHNPVSTNIATIQYQQILSQSSIEKYCHNPVSTNIATIQYQQILPQSSINKYCHNPVSTNIAIIQYQQILPQSIINKYCHLTLHQTKLISQTDVVASDHLRIITHFDMTFSLMLQFGILHSTSEAVSSFDSNAHLILTKKAQGSVEVSGNTNVATQHTLFHYHTCTLVTSVFR